MTYLTDDPIDLQKLIASVYRPSDGALAVFAGIVRNHHDGRAVESIFYDAYRPMAEKQIQTIAQEVRAAFPDVALAVLHRLGEVHVGEASLAIVCTSPHRAEAYAANREIIERIKVAAPIWKKEKGPHGEEWVGWQGASRC